MALVYINKRLDNKEIFYVGISKGISRPYSKSGRNNWWKKIVEKTDYEVFIIKDDISWKEACIIEISLIKELKELGNNLCNLTNGGEGTLGYLFTEEHKKKLSEKGKGRIFSEEHKRKLRENNKSSKLPKKEKISRKKRETFRVIDSKSKIIYPSIDYVCKKYGYKYGTLEAKLKGRIKNNTNFKLYNEK